MTGAQMRGYGVSFWRACTGLEAGSGCENVQPSRGGSAQLRLRKFSVLTVRRQPGFNFDTDAIRRQRTFQTMAAFQRELLALRILLQIQATDDVLAIEGVQVKVLQPLQDKAYDHVFGADKEALAVYLTRHFERVDPDSGVTRPM